MTNKSPYSKEFLKEIKGVLLARREKIEDQLKGFAKTDPKQKFNYNSNFPQFGDKEDENAAEVAAFEGNLSLEETLEQSIEMINKALKKMEDGSYGICEKTGEPIGEARLRIMPTATKKVPEKKPKK